MKNIIFIPLSVLFMLISCKANIPYSNDMKTELKEMYEKDQKAQEYDMTKVQQKSYSDSMETAFNQLSRKNSEVIKKYFAQNGLPKIKADGKETSFHFWVLTQHCDHDVDFQKKILVAMKKELKNKNVSPQNYAYLYDRVQKNLNKPQLYGTQMIWDENGIHSLYNLKSPESLNDRRKKMELEPIADYMKLFEKNSFKYST